MCVCKRTSFGFTDVSFCPRRKDAPTPKAAVFPGVVVRVYIGVHTSARYGAALRPEEWRVCFRVANQNVCRRTGGSIVLRQLRA